MIFKSKVLETYINAAPYISNINWIKKVILKTMNESTSLEEFKEKISQLYKEQNEITKKNDLKIFLIFLEKWLK